MRVLRRLTFELTPTAETGVVSPVCDDATAGTDRAYNACRSGSGAERGVRRHLLCFDSGGISAGFEFLSRTRDSLQNPAQNARWDWFHGWHAVMRNLSKC